MAIVLPAGRPAIDIIKGTYDEPEEPWSYLGDPERRARLEAAIAAVGRVDYIGHPHVKFGGTAFVVGPNLLLAAVGDIIDKNGARQKFKPGHSAVIDFGHERTSRRSRRATVEEVIDVDPVWGVQLVRASLPAKIQPLSLSLVDPKTLEGAEVVLLGYPAWDHRNDSALMQRIFRGVFDVKRMLPGRVRGLELWKSDGRPALAHDCTSTGGCGSAPLVDVRTGQVVGVQFAGKFLEMNFAAPAADLATQAFVHAGVRFSQAEVRKILRHRSVRKPLHVSPALAEELSERTPVPANTAAKTTSSAEATGQPDADTLANIVLGEGRPALLVENWRTEASDTWEPLLMSHKKRLDVAARSVGKLLTDISSDRWSGTAFLVGDRLALTASFAVQGFVEGGGARVTIKADVRAAVDFSEALGLPAGSALAAITSVRFIHPFFHLALLELEHVPEGAAALDVAAQIPSDLSGRAVAVFSFAIATGDVDGELAATQNSLYRSRWGRMFLQPGKALQVGQIPGSPALPALVHDCTTTAGSAGAPVLDMGTGYVIGVHTHARWLESGYAQPTWEFARDPHVWPYAINFRPDPRPLWLNKWEGEDSHGRQAVPVERQPPGPARWTVDDVPIDWSRKEPQELEALLVGSIDAQMALYFAETAGLQLGTVNSAAPGLLLWREIIKKASIAGVLGRLLEQLASKPQNAAIAPKLRAFL